MNFALSDEHRMLRETTRAFLDKEADLAPLLVPGATVASTRYDGLWQKMVELGWAGLVIPEAYGGLGLSYIDLIMVVEQAGRTLAPSPLLGALAGTWALLAAGTEAQKQRILPAVASSGSIVAIAGADPAGVWGRADDLVIARSDHGKIKLTGSRAFVLDAANAEHMIVAAQWEGAQHYFLVDRDAPGLSVELVDWRDITRQVCAITLNEVPAEPMAATPAACWPWIRDRLYLALAAESVGGLQHVLDTTVAYAKERVAFGRPIGAFQAIKHQLADMKAQTECASVALLYAAWALSENDSAAELAAAMAQSYASEAFCDAAFRSIQIFGAIGFTWEMRNHLYFKRARANAEFLGSSSKQRSEVFSLLKVQHRVSALAV